MKDETLFDSLARHRPEWLVQGAFIRAIKTEQAVRELLIQKLKKEKKIGSVDPKGIPNIEEEHATVEGWRADVLVEWSSYQQIKIELKLNAPASPQQIKSGKKRKIDVAIVPYGEKGNASEWALDAILFDWREIEDAINDAALKRLIHEADEASSWYMESIKREEAQKDFVAFVKSNHSEGWALIYRFISTIDAILWEAEEARYYPSKQWSKSRTEPDYWYGYNYTWKTNQTGKNKKGYWGWIGFEMSRGEEIPVFHWYDEKPEPRRAWGKNDYDLSANKITSFILEELRKKS